MSRSQLRFETLNRLVDEVLPCLSNAESVLLLYYFRHASVVGKGERRRNVFRKSDGQAAKELAKSPSAVRKTRHSLMAKGAVSRFVTPLGKTVWVIGSSPDKPHPANDIGEIPLIRFEPGVNDLRHAKNRAFHPIG